MDRKQWIIRIATGLAILVVLVAAGIGLYRLGYSNGVTAGAQTSRPALARAADDDNTTGFGRGSDGQQPGRQGNAPGSPDGQTQRPGQNKQQPGEGSGRWNNGMAMAPGHGSGTQAQTSGRAGMAPQREDSVRPLDGSRRLPAAGLQPAGWASPLGLILLAAVIGFALWIVYRFVTLLVTGNGWQLSFSRIEDSAPPTKTKK